MAKSASTFCRFVTGGFLAMSLIITNNATAQTNPPVDCVTECTEVNSAIQAADPITTQYLEKGLATVNSLEEAAKAACQTTCAKKPVAATTTTAHPGPAASSPPPGPAEPAVPNPLKSSDSDSSEVAKKSEGLGWFWWTVIIVGSFLVLCLIGWGVNKYRGSRSTVKVTTSSSSGHAAPVPVILAAILAGSLFASSNAQAQTPPAPPTQEDGAIRARLAQEGLLKLSDDVASLRSRLARAGVDKLARKQIVELQKQIADLENQDPTGCVKFTTEKAQADCLASLKAESSGTAQKALDTVVALDRPAAQPTSRVTKNADGTEIVEQFAPGATVMSAPCKRNLTFVHNGAYKGTLIRADCMPEPTTAGLTGLPMDSDDEGLPKWAEWAITVGLGTAIGAGGGCGIGEAIKAESISASGYSASGCETGSWIGALSGAALSAGGKLIYDAVVDD